MQQWQTHISLSFIFILLSSVNIPSVNLTWKLLMLLHYLLCFLKTQIIVLLFLSQLQNNHRPKTQAVVFIFQLEANQKYWEERADCTCEIINLHSNLAPSSCFPGFTNHLALNGSLWRFITPSTSVFIALYSFFITFCCQEHNYFWIRCLP